MSRFHLAMAAIIAVMFSSLALGTAPNAAENAEASQWAAQHLDPAGKILPFSFVFDGKPSADLLATWEKKTGKQDLGNNRTRRTSIRTDPKTGLVVRCVAVEYSDFPVVEWTVYLKNSGQKDTPILERIQGLDLQLKPDKDPDFTLHYHRGDFDFAESYRPFEQVLFPNTTQVFSPVGGKPTSAAYPYFNLQEPDGGLILAVGWPGQWATAFERRQGQGVHIRAGQELTHLRLQPGEEIRTPLIALLFWQGTDSVRAQNLWRRWMLAHNLPRPGGKLPPPIYAFCDGGFFPGMKTNEAGEKEFIDALLREGIKLDYWWIDAGWYPCDKSWGETGTWEPDPVRYPHGLKAVSDYVHGKGMKLIVWCEPERATERSWLAENRPEWLLGRGGDSMLVNLGNPQAREWVTNHFDKLITGQGIDLYRQDFNMDPLDSWRKNDPPDRQGVTENLHVQGYLAYWDELRRRHPDMLIDSCASGGRRNDLETLRRAVPLLRSDYQGPDPALALGNQGHTYGLSSWVPYYGQGVYYTAQQPVYCARSYLSPAYALVMDLRKPGWDWDLYRRLAGQWRQVADRMLGDFYPLTPYSLESNDWIAWQFDRPEQGDGMIQAFRHDKSAEASLSLRLHGLDTAAQYRVTDIDVGTPKTMSGKELEEKGLAVEIKDQPGAVIWTYSKVK